MFDSSLRSEPAPPPHTRCEPVVDILEEGLTLTTELDEACVDKFLSPTDEHTTLFLVASEPGTATHVLIVAPPDQLAVLWSKRLQGILLCAARRTWIDAQIAAAALVTRRENRPTAGKFFLKTHAARLAASIPSFTMGGRVGEVYRTAKCRELFCIALHDYLAGELVPVSGDACSAEDSRRLVQAQRLIATRFSERLTLNTIGRACGLNRTKLTTGFRELFNHTVAAALSEARLNWAAEELRSRRVSISQIAYASGYLSHASFTRAFSKHYGIAPKDWRKKAGKSPSTGLSLC